MNPNRPAAEPLLTDPVLPRLIRFALPNMGAMLATALAAIAETSYVGSFGPAALAGMALVFPFFMFQMMLSGGAMGGGVSSAISRALGAGDTEKANALATQAFAIALLAGVAFMVVMLTLGRTIYAILGGENQALDQAMAYSGVAFTGSVFVWLVNTFASVIRGAGNMMVPSITLFLVALLQVIVGGALGLGWGPFPRLEMAGVAAGGVVAYGVGAVWLWRYLCSGRARITMRLTGFRFVRHLLADILRVGAVASISPVQTVLTILILTRLVADFGTDALAGYGIGTRLEFLLIPIAFAIGVASVPLVGMAIGAGDIARARRAAWTAAALSAATLGTLGIAVAVFPGIWTGLFTDVRSVSASAQHYFLWAGPCYGLFGVGLSLYFSSLGAGKAAGPVLAGTLRLVIVIGGGLWLAAAHAPEWSIFALVGAGMAVYGIGSVVIVALTRWHKPH